MGPDAVVLAAAGGTAAEAAQLLLCGAMALHIVLSSAVCAAFARIVAASAERHERLKASDAWEEAKEVRWARDGGERGRHAGRRSRAAQS